MNIIIIEHETDSNHSNVRAVKECLQECNQQSFILIKMRTILTAEVVNNKAYNIIAVDEKYL